MQTMGWRPTRAVFLLPLLFAATSGCVAVHPYQRGWLAKPKMQIDPDAEAIRIEQHVYAQREGSAGGYGGKGGGCGCN